jgi:hypothetical protein
MKFKFIIACALSLLSVLAQTDRGIISGSAVDSSGAIIPDAKVTATQIGTNATFDTVTTSSGDFTIPSLPVGQYRVRVERQGFKSFVANDVILTAGNTVSVRAVLQVGAVAETIEVTSSSSQVQTENAKTQTAVSQKLVDELPLVVGGAMRSAFDLALVAPQTNRPQGTPNQGNEADKAFSIGGGQAGAYGANLDGVTILTGRFNQVQWASVNTPSVDAITEFAVETSGFKAEYGRAQGGLITFTSKSGTNDFHGTAYEFLRNNAFDARRFFEDRKGIYKQNDFGWSAGGPVWIPKLYNGRNKTFFFASQEWFRNRVGAASNRFSVPTPEMFQGDFRNWVDGSGNRLPIYDPTTTRPNPNGAGFIRDAFPNNQIPTGRFSDFSKAVIGQAAGLTPNGGGTPGTLAYVQNNYINNSGIALDPWSKWSVKLDHNFSSNDKVNFLFNDGLHERTPGAAGFPGLPYPLNENRVYAQKSKVYRGTYTKILTPTIVNNFYVGLNYYRDSNRALTYDQGWKAKGVCLKGAWNCDVSFPIITFSDYNTWGPAALDGSDNNSRTFGNDLTFSKGRHTFKAGYLYEWVKYGGFGQQKIAGQVAGDRRSTSVPGNNTIATGGGNGFASFLLGEGYSGGTENERYIGQLYESHGMYFQDDWRVNNRLTLNLGLRYEFTRPPAEENDLFSNLDPTRPNPAADNFPGALVFSGFGEGRQNTRRLASGWYGGWGPRLGLAYQLNNKTVIRAGAARTFGVVKAVTGSTHTEGAFLNFNNSSLDNGVTPYFKVDAGLPPYINPPSTNPSFSNGQGISYWDNDAVRLPQNYQYTLSLQRQVKSAVFEASYNGTMGSNLVTSLKRLNQLPFSVLERYGRDLLTSSITSPAAVAAGLRKPYPSFSNNGSVAQALRPFPQYQDVTTGTALGDKSGHSTYHSLVLKFDQRFSSGLSFNTSYVLSKLLTDSDSYDADNSAADHFNRRLEKSIGQYDQTHSYKFNYVYDLPFGKGKKFLNSGVGAWVLGSWRLSGSHQYASGYPLSFGNSTNYLVFNGRSPSHITSYDGWIKSYSETGNWKGSDRYFNPPANYALDSNPNQAGVQQPLTYLGNATRYNPKAREPWLLDESFSVAKSIPFGREGMRVDFRWEIFNAFNRVRFGPGNTNIEATTFGQVTGTLNDPRRMQFALKFYF